MVNPEERVESTGKPRSHQEADVIDAVRGDGEGRIGRNKNNNDNVVVVARSALQDAIDRKPLGSSYYYAHARRNGNDDLPAPLPPEGGTRLAASSSIVDDDDDYRGEAEARVSSNHRLAYPPPNNPAKLRQNKQRSSQNDHCKYSYYYSRPKVVADEAPAPMPPEGGTLLARGAPVTAAITDEREIPLRKYYFEDDGAWVKVTFPLQGIGSKTTTSTTETKEEVPVEAPALSSSSNAAAKAEAAATVTVVFGTHGKRSFEVTVRGYRPPPLTLPSVAVEHKDEGSSNMEEKKKKNTTSVMNQVLKFSCRKTHGDIVTSKCDWSLRRDKVVVRLFKDPDGVNKHRPWPKIM